MTNTRCPSCKQAAPTIVRGLLSYCTACGAPRSLLDEMPVNVAGQPSRIGGGVASVLGWLILVGGALLALGVGALFQAIFPTVIVGYVLGGFLGGMSLLLGLGLIFGGRKLSQRGDARVQSAREEVVFGLAGRRGGSVTVAELSRSLSIPEAEADALLTELAKRPDGRVTLEVDDDGTLRYVVPELVPRTRIAPPGGRQDARVGVAPGARIATPTDAEALVEAEQEQADAALRERR